MVILILVVFGLCLGSFVNALVWRVREQDKRKSSRLSIMHGRSMCPHCRHELAWYDLVPVLSWLSLKGKCRYCRKAISWQYPLVELATAGLFVLSYLFWPEGALFQDFWATIRFIGWLPLLAGFMALLVYDIRWMLLPNRIMYPVLGIVSLLTLANIADGGVSAALNALYGLLVGGGLFMLIFQVSAGKWIGGGDVKLGFAAGLLLADPVLAFLMLMTASTLGTLVVLPALAVRRLSATSRIPFGPFLIIGTIFVRLFGQAIVDWYKNSIGP